MPEHGRGSAEESVRWGILSTARINELVLAGAREASGVEVIGIASRDGGRAAAYAAEHGIERAYEGYERLLEDPDVEAVYISLPNRLHAEWSIRALEAGKHVLCEKPLGGSAAEVEAAFDAAERSGRLLMEAFMYRHHPQTATLCRLVESGAIGTVRLVRGVFSFAVDDPADPRLSGALAGGSLMDLGCYCVNTARLIAGEPVRVSAEQVTNAEGVDVRFAGTARFAGGVVARFFSALDLPYRDELEVAGDGGSLFLDDPWHGWTETTIDIRRDGATEAVPIEPVDPYRLELENLSDAIRGRAEPLLGRSDAVAQARAIEAFYRAAETGRTVPVEEEGRA